MIEAQSGPKAEPYSRLDGKNIGKLVLFTLIIILEFDDLDGDRFHVWIFYKLIEFNSKWILSYLKEDSLIFHVNVV
jgi:hypothetical protein